MIITRIKLENWKNFHECDVRLCDRSFIVGANASGKSNFLDVFRFLRDIARVGGGLQEAVASRGGMTKIRCLAARTKTNIAICVYLAPSSEVDAEWVYKLSFKNVGGGVIKNEVSIIQEEVWHDGKCLLSRGEQSQDEDAITLKYTHLEQPTANAKFRELKDFFDSIQYLNVVPQLVRESGSLQLSSGKEDYYGRNFIMRLSKLNDRTKNSYFKKINEVLKLAVPQLEDLSLKRDDMGVPHLEARYVHWRKSGSKQQEEQFSDGTLRLIGFLFALIDSPGMTLLEEPETNLHSSIVAEFPEYIAKMQRSRKEVRQVILTTHSFDILSNPGIQPDEVLILQNTQEGTLVTNVNEIKQLRAILDAGFSVADAVIPFSKPTHVDHIVDTVKD